VRKKRCEAPPIVVKRFGDPETWLAVAASVNSVG